MKIFKVEIYTQTPKEIKKSQSDYEASDTDMELEFGIPEVLYFTNRVEIGDPDEHSVYGKLNKVAKILGAVHQDEYDIIANAMDHAQRTHDH